MHEIVAVILPVFGLIAIGYGTARLGILKQEVGDALGDFVFTIAVPLLIFRTLATADFAHASPWGLWLSYFGGALIVWAAGVAVVRFGFGRDEKVGVIAGVSTAFSNLVLVGTPLVLTAFGEEGAVPLFLIISVNLPVMMVISTLLIERASRREVAAGGVAEPEEGGSLGLRLMKNIFTNPLILGILAGAAWRATGLAIPALPKTLIDGLATAAVPCALFSLGMALKRYGIAGNVAPAVVLSVLKLLVFPGIVWLIAEYVARLPDLWVTVVTIGAATPTGVNAYLIANRFRTGHGLASNTITITSAAAVVTVALWLRLLGTG